jgi:phosphate transport system ATP-binding protein
MEQAKRIADRTTFFYKGKVIETGDTLDLFTKPGNKLTEDYVTGRLV